VKTAVRMMGAYFVGVFSISFWISFSSRMRFDRDTMAGFSSASRLRTGLSERQPLRTACLKIPESGVSACPRIDQGLSPFSSRSRTRRAMSSSVIAWIGFFPSTGRR
jgi:hypothetical protein